MAKLWLKNGKLLMCDGKVAYADECPCGGSVSCMETSFYLRYVPAPGAPSSVGVSIEGHLLGSTSLSDLRLVAGASNVSNFSISSFADFGSVLVEMQFLVDPYAETRFAIHAETSAGILSGFAVDSIQVAPFTGDAELAEYSTSDAPCADEEFE